MKYVVLIGDIIENFLLIVIMALVMNSFLASDFRLMKINLVIHRPVMICLWWVSTVVMFLIYIYLRICEEREDLSFRGIYILSIPFFFLVILRCLGKYTLGIGGMLIVYVVFLLYYIYANRSKIIGKSRYKRRNRWKLEKHFFRINFYVSCFLLTVSLIAYAFSFRSSTIGKKTENEVENDWQSITLRLQDDVWRKYSETEKLSLLQEMLDLECKSSLGCSPPVIYVGDLPDEIWGICSKAISERAIFVDEEHILNDDICDVTETVFHELYHFFQIQCVEAVSFESDEKMELQYFQEVREWKNNLNNYKLISINGMDAYWNQALEKSARDYSDRRVRQIFLMQHSD